MEGAIGPRLDDLREAHERIAPHVNRTPVLTSSTFDLATGARLHFKCENLQKVGAFKARGAVNAVLGLGREEAERGVITHSSGNHAAALAYAAGVRDVPCTVVMPRQAPPVKIRAVRGYGAEIVFCERDEREEVCARLAEGRGATFVHPFADSRIIAGQGTAALELLDETGPLELLVAPVGGGGLLAGTAIAADGAARVWGAEPIAVDDAHRSLATGVRQPAVENARTFADGLMTGLGEINFRILVARGVRIVTVTESEMLHAARLFLERMKILVEPSAATVLAVLLQQKERIAGKKVGAIISGGNTDLAWLTAVEPEPIET